MILNINNNGTMSALLPKENDENPKSFLKSLLLSLNLIIFILLFIGAIFLYNRILENPTIAIYLNSFYPTLLIALFLFNKMLFIILRKLDTFMSFCLKFNSLFFTLQLTFIEMTCFVLINKSMPKNSQVECYEKILIATTTFLSVISLMVILLCMLDYNVHQNFLHKRIVENEYILKIIRKLSDKFNFELSEPIKDWAKRIFMQIFELNSGQSDENKEESNVKNDQKSNTRDNFVESGLDSNMLSSYLNQNEVEDFFSIFDIDLSGTLIESEFINGILYLYKDKIAIKQSIKNHNQMYSKLQMIFLVIFIPFAAFIASLTLDAKDLFSKTVGPVAGFFVPMTFIFGSSLSEVFQSIFFIFCVRPYDISDYIIFDRSIYQVKNMGLTYTELFKDGKIKIVMNQTLKNANITNLRFSNEIYDKIGIKVKRNQSISKMLSFLKKYLKNFTDNHSKLYGDKISFENFHYSAESMVFDICFVINIGYTGVQGVKERRDKMARFIDENLLKLGFELA